MSKEDQMLDMLKEMKQEQKEERKDTQTFREDVKEFMGKTDQRLSNLEDDMRTHIEGVQQNRKRIEILEQPMSVKKLVTIITGAGSVAGAIIAILKLLEII